LLREPELTSHVVSEVNFKPTVNPQKPVHIEGARIMRTNTCLRNPDYMFVFTPMRSWWGDKVFQKDPTETHEKNWNMSVRRLKHGKQHRPPYFGMSDYPASYEYVDKPQLKPVPVNRNLGIMYWGIDYADPQEPSYYTALSVVDGVVRYPTVEEVRKNGLKLTDRRS
jgi:hypothetical protein